MIARERLMHAMAAAFTDAELAAMQTAVQHEQAQRAEDRARKARLKQPPIPREEQLAPEAAAVRHVSGLHQKRAAGTK